MIETRPNPFRISLGYRRVYTTFPIELKTFRQIYPELVEQRSLFGGGFGDPAQTNLTPIRGGQYDVGALQRGEQC